MLSHVYVGITYFERSFAFYKGVTNRMGSTAGAINKAHGD